jgi:N-acetylmuramoyl-L-alanine amidase
MRKGAKEDGLVQPKRRLFLGWLLRTAGAAVSACACPIALALGRERQVVDGLSVSPFEGYTRVVLSLRARVEQKLFVLSNPDRVVIDLPEARFDHAMPSLDLRGTVVRGVRSAARDGGDLRLVLDLARESRPRATWVRGPNGGYQLFIDLLDRNGHAAQPALTVSRKATRVPLRDVVVVIDPGHGGKDPGAIGPRGTQEKDVVLSVARKLAAMVQASRGMRAVLTRDRDVFLPLRARIQKARRHRADLFVSIHADAYPQSTASGSSVFVLSERGASSEAARWLAERENASDLIGGVSLDDKEPVLASVLLDLSQTAAIEASIDAAARLLSSLRSVGALHKSDVQSAGFVVLKSPDIPSVLVETAFLTNPREESKLRDPHHQAELAAAIMSGIRAYFGKRAPAGTWLASRQHVISQGETLGSIAQHYNVSVDSLRLANGLSTDRVYVGEVLRIPAREDG